jgi:1-acyl-sn-glycerol-3-phosphate acyltransferase
VPAELAPAPADRAAPGLAERARGALVLGYTVVSAPACIAASLPLMLATGSGDASIWLARHVWSPLGLWLSGARLEVSTLAPLPEGPAIYAANHESILDPWALFVSIPRSLRFVAKTELFRIPVFGRYLRIAKFVEVDRSNRARAVASLRAAGELVRAGTSIAVFPEGTRSEDGRVHAFKKGPFALAEEARVPVVPVAICGSGNVVRKGRVAARPGTIRVAIGPAVEPATHPGRNALLAEVRRRIVEQHRALGGADGDPVEPSSPSGAGNGS